MLFGGTARRTAAVALLQTCFSNVSHLPRPHIVPMLLREVLGCEEAALHLRFLQVQADAEHGARSAA